MNCLNLLFCSAERRFIAAILKPNERKNTDSKMYNVAEGKSYFASLLYFHEGLQTLTLDKNNTK